MFMSKLQLLIILNILYRISNIFQEALKSSAMVPTLLRALDKIKKIIKNSNIKYKFGKN